MMGLPETLTLPSVRWVGWAALRDSNCRRSPSSLLTSSRSVLMRSRSLFSASTSDLDDGSPWAKATGGANSTLRVSRSAWTKVTRNNLALFIIVGLACGSLSSGQGDGHPHPAGAGPRQDSAKPLVLSHV